MTSTPREVPSNFSAVIAPVVMALISRVVQRSRICSSSGVRTDYTDSPDRLLLLPSISVFLLFGFSVLHFLVVGSVR